METPIVEEPFQLSYQYNEHKFLTISQIIEKIFYKPRFRDKQQDLRFRERAVWAFQKASWCFPTIIILKICLFDNQSEFHDKARHHVALYFGADIHRGILTHNQIRHLLERHGYECPDHFHDL